MVPCVAVRARAAPTLLAVLLLSLLAGCAPRAARPLCPAAGGSPWVRIESAHFVVFTDLDEEDAIAALTLAFPGARLPTERTEVVVFRDKNEFRAFVAGNRNGVFFNRWGGDP